MSELWVVGGWCGAQLRVWPTKSTEEQQVLVNNEESIVYSQAVHYVNRMVCLRVPLDGTKKLREPATGMEGESLSSMITNRYWASTQNFCCLKHQGLVTPASLHSGFLIQLLSDVCWLECTQLIFSTNIFCGMSSWLNYCAYLSQLIFCWLSFICRQKI